MSQGTASEAVAESMIGASSAKERVFCQECGSDRVVRVHRKGYMQEKIYPMFGYYPWRCMRCGWRVMLRKRHRSVIGESVA
jgi:DNA-directed RNA polymerase subunit RPC12/RpoP